ncbi:MAG: flavoprotein [Acidimicrobiia bacterium]|nr:flavoprotein [Acidimicrobiia bacterium]
MTSFGSTAGDVLYLVVCAATGAEHTVERVRREQADGWDVCVVATPLALTWFDPAAVTETSGHMIQSRMRTYGEPLFQPLGDAVTVAPASFNTINKVAVGMADNMATGLICEALSRGVPVAMEPSVGDGFAAHPAFAAHVATLRRGGVTFHWAKPGHDPARAEPGGDRPPS